MPNLSYDELPQVWKRVDYVDGLRLRDDVEEWLKSNNVSYRVFERATRLYFERDADVLHFKLVWG